MTGGLAQNYQTRVEILANDKHSSLLHWGMLFHPSLMFASKTGAYLGQEPLCHAHKH
jgi:hypothetical protein